MSKWPKGVGGNPTGRPLAARGLRAQIEARFGPDGEGLITELHELTRSRNHRVRLEALRLLSAYYYGPPQQRVALDLSATSTREVTPVMLAQLTTEELHLLMRISERWEPPKAVLFSDRTDDAADPGASPETSGS
jgi:hypothetical protein